MKPSKRRRSRGSGSRAEAPAHAANELLLQQLHQVQEELEAHYLRCLDLDAELQLAAIARDDAVREADALRLQLAQMQRALSGPDPAGGKRAGIGGRVARLLASRMMGRRNDSGAHPEVEAIRGCDWFDADWYLATYADVRAAGMDPAVHFHEFGWKEGRNPGPGFDAAWYLRTNPDVAAAGVNPLLHFVQYGSKEGRLPRGI